MSPLMSPLHPAPVFGAKSAQNGRVRRVRFSCRTASGMPEPPSSLVFRRKPAPDVSFPLSARKSGEFQPAEHVTACHRFVEVVRQPAELVTTDVTTDVTAPSGSGFWCKKRLKRSSPKSPFFVSDCKWDARASKFAGFRSKAGSRRQFSAFGPEKRRIPARRACHRLSPLRHRLSPLRHRFLWGRKVRKRLGKAKPALRLRSNFALARAWCGPGVVQAWCAPAGLVVRAWCGPGCGAGAAWCGPGNPVVGTGLLPQSCCGNRIVPAIPASHTGLP